MKSGVTSAVGAKGRDIVKSAVESVMYVDGCSAHSRERHTKQVQWRVLSTDSVET